MTSTIENTNGNILSRIKNLKNIINIYSRYKFDDIDDELLVQLTTELNDCQLTYELGSLNLLIDYYQAKHEDDKKVIYLNYMKFITVENIIGKLKRIYSYCKRFYKIYNIDDPNLDTAFHQYDCMNINSEYIDTPNDMCVCGTRFVIEAKNAEFVCHKCGQSKKLYGVVFEDEQFFYQEGQRTKHGKYDPTKHCKFWVDRIQAKENTEIPTRVLKKIKKCIKRDNIRLDRLTCPIIRSYLKELRLTTYNDHVPLIRKLITGKEPEQLSEYELKLVYNYFSRVIQIYNKTKPNNKPNCPYHPFFIYKILEQILKHPRQIQKRNDILSCIHLQSRETLIENDNIWKPICAEISEFIYIPTDNS